MLVLLLIMIYVFFFTNNGVGIFKPKEVTLTGTVTTTGTDAAPQNITFTSLSTQEDYVVICTGGGNPAHYSIILPNGDSYKVTITWKSIELTQGSTDAGTLNLDTGNQELTKDWAG